MRALVAMLLIAGGGWAYADDEPAALAPCVQRLVQADVRGAARALAAVRQEGIAVAPDLRRAIKQNAANEKRWLRLRRALAWITEDWQRAQTPKGMVYVPAGPVEVPRDERPHGPAGKRVDVAAFYIDKTEATVGAWRAWCAALTAREAPRTRWHGPPIAEEVDAHLPVGGISQEAAARHAREHRAGRLPTVTEFERALRGSGLRAYPWGNVLQPNRANLSWGRAPGRPCPVGSYPLGASPFGVLDLVGNLAEWTSTLEPHGQVGKRPLVLGGSFRDEPAPGLTWRSAARPRDVDSPRSSAPWIGFRVVKSAPPLPDK